MRGGKKAAVLVLRTEKRTLRRKRWQLTRADDTQRGREVHHVALDDDRGLLGRHQMDGGISDEN